MTETITVLFTDLVESTAISVDIGDDDAEARAFGEIDQGPFAGPMIATTPNSLMVGDFDAGDLPGLPSDGAKG